MNKQLFIAKAVTQNSKASADLLADGEIGIFGSNAITYLTEKVVAGTLYEYAFVALGRAANKGSRIGRNISITPKKRNLQWKKFGYSPPISKTYLVTTTCLGKSQYDDFVLRVRSRYGEDFSGEEKDFKEYHAQGKFTTTRQIYDEWLRLIGLDSSSQITATSSDAGLLVQGKTWDQVINFGTEYYDNPAKAMCATCTDCTFTIAVQNEGDAGSGHYWHLQKLAREASPYLGAKYDNDRMITNPGADLDAAIFAAGNCDILYIQWSNEDQPGGDHGKVFNVYQELFIAFPTGTNTAAIETVLTQVIGQPIKVSLAS